MRRPRLRNLAQRIRHSKRSLASRVTLLTALAVAFVVTAVAVGAYVIVRSQTQSALDDSLLQRAHAAASLYLVDAETGDSIVPTWVLGAGDVRVATLTSTNQVDVPDFDKVDIFQQLGAPELAVADGRSSYSIRSISAGDDHYRVVAVPLGTGRALVVAQSLAPQDRVARRMGLLMLLIGACGVIAAGVAGWGVATGGLRPVRRLTAAVERIARTEDLSPLPVTGDDEIARLASSFNEMLVALAASRDRQRQLVADAGHELRTPLTSMRTNIDLLSQLSSSGQTVSPEQRDELLGDIRAQMEELTTLIGDLVELARDEPLAPVVEAFDLPEVVERALSRVHLRAPGVSWQLDTEPWWVLGEVSSIERAVTNLLDNAAKWSPAEGTVRVTLHGGRLTVDDEGPGIADADLPHVFDRFYRSTESRSMPGSGLGLSIVRQTAEKHGGTVQAGRSPQGGARLVLSLPGAATPAPRTAPAGV